MSSKSKAWSSSRSMAAYGLIAEGDIPKPAFNAFQLLHWLGDERLAVSSNDLLVTRRQDGSLVIAAWNLTRPGAPGAAKTIQLNFAHTQIGSVRISRVDAQHGDIHAAYESMGSPLYPTREQIEKLRAASHLAPRDVQPVTGSSLEITIPGEGLVLIEARPAS